MLAELKSAELKDLLHATEQIATVAELKDLLHASRVPSQQNRGGTGSD